MQKDGEMKIRETVNALKNKVSECFRLSWNEFLYVECKSLDKSVSRAK